VFLGCADLGAPVSDYELLRQRHATRLFELMPALFERLTWPVDRLRDGRQTALHALLRHAVAHSPWHRRRLDGLDVDQLAVADLAALPSMTKHDLMDHFDEIVTDRRLTRDLVEAHLESLTTDAYLLDEYHVCASGGSSGRRGVFVYDFDGWACTFASYMRFTARVMQEVFGGEAPAMVMVAADKASHMTSAMAQTFPSSAAQVQRLPATWPMPRIVDSLNALQPAVLLGYASVVHQLVREAVAGRLRIAPRMVATTSEPLLPEIRAAIAAVWPVPLLNGFGSTEGLMGGSCSAGCGIHLSDDLFIIEPVDARGRAVAVGTPAAKVYVTSLYNLTQPLIRYELTDEMTVLGGPCPCGITLLRIDDIQGRLDDNFQYPNGPSVHPFTYRSILGREREIVEYQVRQTPMGADILVCAEGPVDTARIAAAIREALFAQGLADAAVTVSVVTALDRATTGKFRRFVPLAAH